VTVTDYFLKLTSTTRLTNPNPNQNSTRT